MELEGRVALVTGASRGIGAATAFALAEAGCAVACAARSTDDSPQRTPGTLDAVVRRISDAGGRAVAVPTDLSNPRQIEPMVATTVATLGGLDILINNAAITFVGDLDLSDHRHDLVMAVNLEAPRRAIRAARPHLAERGGAVINVSSLAALVPYPKFMSYGISKLALERLTVDVAQQLAPDGISVNCFRIDVAVASEGFVANSPGADLSTWEPCEVAAEGLLWMLRQPPSYSGRLESMWHLRRREHIMPSRAAVQSESPPPITHFGDPPARPAV